MVKTFGDKHIDSSRITICVNDVFNVGPDPVLDHSELRRPIYARMGAYRHCGREGLDSFTWEHLARLDQIIAGLGL